MGGVSQDGSSSLQMVNSNNCSFIFLSQNGFQFILLTIQQNSNCGSQSMFPSIKAFLGIV